MQSKFPAGAQRLLPQPGDEFQSLGHRFLQAGRLGRGARGRAHQGRPRRRHTSSGSAAWAPTTTPGKASPRRWSKLLRAAAGVDVRDARRRGEVLRRFGPPPRATNTSSRAWPRRTSTCSRSTASGRSSRSARTATTPSSTNTRSCWTRSPACGRGQGGLRRSRSSPTSSSSATSSRAGRLAPKTGGTGRYTFHDPCYLGRHNGLIAEPRAVLAAVLGRPAERSSGATATHSFCCGAGGGLMWTEESLGTRINHLRTDEIIASGAPLAASACPFCLTMLRDGLKDKGRDGHRGQGHRPDRRREDLEAGASIPVRAYPARMALKPRSPDRRPRRRRPCG